MFSRFSSRKSENLISVEDFAKKVRAAIPEIANYEIRRWAIIFTFNSPRKLPSTHSVISHHIFALEHQELHQTTFDDFIKQLRDLLDNSSVVIAPIENTSASDKPKP